MSSCVGYVHEKRCVHSKLGNGGQLFWADWPSSALCMRSCSSTAQMYISSHLSLSPLRCPKTDTQSHSPIRPTCSPDNKQKSNVHSKSQYSVCYDGVSPATPLEHDYCTSSSSSSRHGGGEGGGRRQRKGTGSSGQVWDLRMKLDHKAASREGDSADHRDRGSRRREKRRGGL